MYRRLSFAIVSVAIFLTCIFASSSYESPKIMIPRVEHNVYVYDQGDFLDDNVEEEINKLLVQLEEKTTVEFVIITIPTLNGLSIERYAVKLGNELGIGKADTDNGILLLISREDTKVRLEIGIGIQDIFTDSICGKILDEYFVPFRAEDDYDVACINTVQAAINRLADSGDYDFSIDGIDRNISVEQEEPLSVWQLLIIDIVILIAFILIIVITGYCLANGFGGGIIGARIDSSSSSGSSFGGGSFGGGGASR